VPVNEQESLLTSNHIPSAMASGSFQSSFDPYDLSIDDDEFLTHTIVAETPPRSSDPAAHVLTAARLYFNSPPEAPETWGQMNPNLNDCHSNPMEISSTYQIPDITDWCQQHDEMH